MTTAEAARHFTAAELQERLRSVDGGPTEIGRVELVVRRPSEGERELPDEAELDLELGLVGDRWSLGRSHGRPPNLDAQVTLMSARAAELVAGTRERWALAGDQLYVEIDISEQNLVPGTRLAVGTAVLEVSHEPHTGCKKFVARFGRDATLLVNSPEGRALRLRGMNTRIVEPGLVRPGDEIRKL